MKNTNIKIENNGTFIEFNLETTNGKSMGKVQKALVYRFFDYYDTLRSVGSKCFKGSEPFVISLHINGVSMWDTSVLDVKAQARLKLINNPKGRRAFESRLEALIGFAIRTKETNTDTIIKDVEERLMSVEA
jgi:hypothetical protein